MTSERREESVQVSLVELTRLEDERIEREARQREAAEVAALAAREATERRLREERERERVVRVEEEARREAMSRAAVEQARIAVEVRARAEESERARRHELELVRLRAEVRRSHGPGRLVASGVLGAALAFAACGAAYLAAIEPTQARTVEGLEGAALRAEAKANDVERESVALGRRVTQLEAELRAANAEVARLHAKPAAKTPASQPGPGGHGLQPPNPPAPALDKCAGSLDPVCGLDLRRAK